jgi:nucleoside phosphorylase
MILVVASSWAELSAFSPDHPAIHPVAVGVGLVQSALNTYAAIEECAPTHVVGIGSCCALSPEYPLGSVIFPSEVIHYGIDLRRFGLPRGSVYSPSGKRFGLLTVDPLFHSVQHKACRIGSADRFSTPEDRQHYPWMRDELHLDAVDMESYAMVAAARRAQVPVTIIRAVSDSWDAGRLKDLPAFLHNASQQIREYIESYSEPREKSPVIL